MDSTTAVDERDGIVTAGDVSLREAIQLANALSGTQSITFDTGLSGTDLILESLLGPLKITDDVMITGLGANQVTIVTDSISVSSNATATIDAMLAGISVLSKTGDGVLVITGTAADLVVEEGTLILASTGSVQDLRVGSHATAILHGEVQGNLINDGTIVVAGDLNGDGSLNANDIDALYDQLLGTDDHNHPRFDLISDNVRPTGRRVGGTT